MANEKILERNVGRLVRRWAEPVTSEQVDEACRDFLRRLDAPDAPSAGGRLGFAAALLLGGLTFWAIFAWRDVGAPAPEPVVPAATVQADEKAKQAGNKEKEPVRESAVLAALKWLARHQAPDGSWGADSFKNQCVGEACSGPGERDYDAGLTALSLLAFLHAGYSQLSKDEYPDPAKPERLLKFGEVFKKGLQWLLTHQDREGCVGDRGMKYMYNHALATLCLAEAYGQTASQPLRIPAQKATDFLVAAQNPGKGWRYSPKCGDNDTSVLSWAVQALRAAQLSELNVPKEATTGALNWLNEVTEQNGTFKVGYNALGTGKVYVPGKNESYVYHPTMSAISILCRIFMGQRETEPAMTAVNLLAADLPQWLPDHVDFYYWHYGSQALYQVDGPEGPMWKQWNEAMKQAIVPHQKVAADGCRNGSWNPEEERWGHEGGRVYMTAIGALTLEVYYRYGRVWDKK